MYDCVDCLFTHKFHPNNSTKPLKDCNELKFSNLKYLKNTPYKKLIYCRIQEDELDYFLNHSLYNDLYNNELYYDINCGEKKKTFFKVFRFR